MLPLDRVGAESVIQTLIGGGLPNDRDRLRYKQDIGWALTGSPSVFDIEDFGAIDGDGTDDTAAFQAAIDAAGKGDTVLIPDGTYVATGQVNLKAGVSLTGVGTSHAISGPSGSLVLHKGTGRLFSFIGDGTQANSSGVILSGFGIRGELASGDAIYIEQALLCALRDLHINMVDNSANAVRSGGGSCVVANGAVGGGIEFEISGCRLQGGRYGILIQNAQTTVYVIHTRIEDTDSGNAPSGAGAGIKVEGSSNGLHIIERSVVESCNGPGIHVLGPESQIQILNNWFELNNQIVSGDQDILLEGTSGNILSRCWIAGNRINSSGVSTGLDMRFTSECVVMINNFGSAAPTSVLLDANSNDNLFLWNRPAGAFIDNGTKNIRNERDVVNDLGSNPRLQGPLNFLGQVARDTTFAGTPTFGFVSATPEGAITAAPGSIRTGRLIVSSNDMCGNWVKALGAGNVSWVLRGAGSGTPEGNVAAPVGSVWQRTDGGAGTSFYVKESGTGNTGWVGK